MLRNIVSGLNWNTAGQITTVLIYLGLTPFLLIHLGVDLYGVFALISSFRGLLSNLDLGLGTTSGRFFAVYAGAQDRRSTAGLLVTMTVLLVVVVGVVAGAGELFAPQIASLFHGSASVHQNAAEIIRWLMPLLVVQAIRSLFQRIVTAQHRWGYLNVSTFASSVGYAAVAAGMVEAGFGLKGLVVACYVQEGVILMLSYAGARSSIRFADCRFLSRKVTGELIRYGLKVQISAVAASFNNEIDAIIVGLIFPVRDVAFYSIGANFTSQLIGLPLNAMLPISVTFARTFGESGFTATLRQFDTLQRLWVRLIGAYPLIGAASAYFAISAWLGSRDHLAGVVAAVLLLGQEMVVTGQVMDAFGKQINRPDLESRYLGIGMIINIAFTIPLAFAFGVIGVPIGTMLGQIASGLYFLRIVHREIDPNITSFLREIPLLAVAAGVATTIALELPLYPVAPRGAAGMVVCAVPAAVGLGVYGLISFGWSESLRRIRSLRVSH